MNNKLYLINDEYGVLWEADTSLNILRTITGLNFGDTEDITFLSNTKYGIVTEAGQLYVGDILNGVTDVEMNVNTFQEITFFNSDNNSGPEGVTYDPINEIIYIVKEKNPMGFFKFTLPNTNLDTLINPEIPFNAEVAFSGIMEDLSSITFDHRTGRVLILSDDSKRIIDVDPESGNIYGILDLEGDSQYEGLAFYDNNYNLIITSEPNLYVKYSRPCDTHNLNNISELLCLLEDLLLGTLNCSWDLDFNQRIDAFDLLILSDILNGSPYFNCSE